MKKLAEKRRKLLQRHSRIRRRLSGTAQQPRLTVFRSLKHIYAHLVDDDLGGPIMGVSSQDKSVAASVSGKSGKIEAATAVGLKLAEKAVAQGIEQVVFDRGGYRYHGRVKAVADGARKGGLKF
jgi:large subunit ribosomal protein L18